MSAPTAAEHDPMVEMLQHLVVRILKAAPGPVEEDLLVEAMEWARRVVHEKTMLDLVLAGRLFLIFDQAGEMRFDSPERRARAAGRTR